MGICHTHPWLRGIDAPACDMCKKNTEIINKQAIHAINHCVGLIAQHMIILERPCN